MKPVHLLSLGMGIGMVLVSCRTTPDLEPRGFGIYPFANSEIEIGARKGGKHALPHPLQREEFQELSIGQGSGWDGGYDSLRIKPDGHVAAVFRSHTNWKRVELQLSEAEIVGLVAALNRDRIGAIKGSYSARGVYDGTQGFVSVVTAKGARSAWLDNHFVPVSSTFAFCNRVVWSKVDPAKAGEKPVDPLFEYQRFKKGRDGH